MQWLLNLLGRIWNWVKDNLRISFQLNSSGPQLSINSA